MKRVVTALILAPLIVYLVLWGPHLAFMAVLTTVALLCFHEYSGLVSAYGVARPGPVGYAAGLILLLSPLDPTPALVVTALAALALGISADDLKNGFPRAAALMLGVLYVFGVWRLAAVLRIINPHWLLFALVVSWVSDTGAYYIGKRFGRHKMAPRVSPGKSWEGAAASAVAAVIFGIVYLTRAIPDVSVPVAIAFALAANAAGQIGDLAESAMKRGAGVKDSGSMLPGHGGWLDRVDSSLFAVPVVYLLAAFLAA